MGIWFLFPMNLYHDLANPDTKVSVCEVIFLFGFYQNKGICIIFVGLNAIIRQ